jgi:hypothetical protein
MTFSNMKRSNVSDLSKEIFEVKESMKLISIKIILLIANKSDYFRSKIRPWI